MKPTIRFILLLIISFFYANCWSQEKRIVVRIDTLDLIDKYEDFSQFKLFVTNQGFANMGNQFDSADFQINEFPKYFNNTVLLQSDSSQLQMTLDNNQRYVEILGFYNSDIDTLQIDKYQLYSNCNYDTVQQWTTYFEDDTLAIDKEKSNYKSIIQPLDCYRQPPPAIELRINGETYLFSIDFGKKQGGLFYDW